MITFIYILRDPRSDEIRYVGKADNLDVRLSQHLSGARKGKRKNKRNAWIRSVLEEGVEPVIEKIDEVNEEEWQAIEAAYIQFYLSEGNRLVNGTMGGDGMSNPSLETRRKMSQSQKGRTPWNKGKHFPGSKHLARLHDLAKGRTPWNKGISPSVEQRRKISEKLAGRKESPEVIERKRISQLKRWEKTRLDRSIQNCMVSV